MYCAASAWLEPHLQPTDIEEKLQQGENRQVEVQIVARVTLSWIQELTTNQTSQEEAVDRHGRHLVKKHQACVLHNYLWGKGLSSSVCIVVVVVVELSFARLDWQFWQT